MKSRKRKFAEMILSIIAGNICLAIAVAAFVVPSGVIMGGATGISLAITHYFPVELSVVVLVANVALFLLGAFVLGKRFAITTVASTLLYPMMLSVFQAVPGIEDLTDNMMLSAVFAGAFLGAGIGMVVRTGSSSGGTDILALVLHKWTHLPVAALMYIVDIAVLFLQIMFSDSEQVLYGVIVIAVQTVIMNRVILMGQSQIQLFVMSEKYEEIRENMLKEQNVGVTMIHVETGYTKKNAKAVLCVIPNRKLYAVNEMVRSIDPKAFITITQINEVHGRGFTIDRFTDEEMKEKGQTV